MSWLLSTRRPDVFLLGAGLVLRGLGVMVVAL